MSGKLSFFAKSLPIALATFTGGCNTEDNPEGERQESAYTSFHSDLLDRDIKVRSFDSSIQGREYIIPGTTWIVMYESQGVEIRLELTDKHRDWELDRAVVLERGEDPRDWSKYEINYFTDEFGDRVVNPAHIGHPWIYQELLRDIKNSEIGSRAQATA